MALRFVLLCIASTRAGAQSACKHLAEDPEFLKEAGKLDKGENQKAMQKCFEAQMQSPSVKAVTGPGGVCEGKEHASPSVICSMPACFPKVKEMKSNFMDTCIPAEYPRLREMGECMVKHMCDDASITDSIMEVIARASSGSSVNVPTFLTGSGDDVVCDDVAVGNIYKFECSKDGIQFGFDCSKGKDGTTTTNMFGSITTKKDCDCGIMDEATYRAAFCDDSRASMMDENPHERITALLLAAAFGAIGGLGVLAAVSWLLPRQSVQQQSQLLG